MKKIALLAVMLVAGVAGAEPPPWIGLQLGAGTFGGAKIKSVIPGSPGQRAVNVDTPCPRADRIFPSSMKYLSAPPWSCEIRLRRRTFMACDSTRWLGTNPTCGGGRRRG